MKCAQCRQPISRDRSWFVIAKGTFVRQHGSTITAEVDLCSEDCLVEWSRARDLLETA